MWQKLLGALELEAELRWCCMFSLILDTIRHNWINLSSDSLCQVRRKIFGNFGYFMGQKGGSFCKGKMQKPKRIVLLCA